MTGLLGHSSSFAKRKLHLATAAARLLSNSVLGRGGTALRGHEFHYATLTAAGDDDSFAECLDAEGTALGKAAAAVAVSAARFFMRSRAKINQADEFSLRHFY